MTQKEKVLLLLRRGPCTAADFLFTRFEDGKMVTNEWRARTSELRRDGYGIAYHRDSKTYTLDYEPPILRAPHVVNQQLELAFHAATPH